MVKNSEGTLQTDRISFTGIERVERVRADSYRSDLPRVQESRSVTFRTTTQAYRMSARGG